MTDIKDGGSAFPQMTLLEDMTCMKHNYRPIYAGGLTKREAFAMAALQGMMAGKIAYEIDTFVALKADEGASVEWLAQSAYMLADAMLDTKNLEVKLNDPDR